MTRGRKAKGSVFFEGGRWKARIVDAAGKRASWTLTAGITREEAEAEAAATSMLVRSGKLVKAAPEVVGSHESCTVWWGRYLEERERKGQAAVRDARGRVNNWILPVIGEIAMRLVGPADLRRVVAKLDAAVESGDIKAKTAANVWGEATSAFGAACKSKVDALRVRVDNPANGVTGPDGGLAREKSILYPSEVLQLLGCEAVPIERRRVYAVAVYTGARSNELAALTAKSIDLKHGRFTVSAQRDRWSLDGADKQTKTKRSRAFAVEPELAPLLAILASEAPTGRLLTMEQDKDRAPTLRADLVTAGVLRHELHDEKSATHLPLWLHHLRDTCLTWMAVRGDDPLSIQFRGGHANFSMTEKYIAQARNVAPNFGTPFPALPASILRPILACIVAGRGGNNEKEGELSVPGTGLEGVFHSTHDDLPVVFDVEATSEGAQEDLSGVNYGVPIAPKIEPDGSDIEAPFVGRPAALQANRALRKCLLAATTYPADELALRRTRGAS